MRRIKIERWKSKVPIKNEKGEFTGDFKMQDEDLLMVLNVLIANKRPEQIPRGLDKFRLFNRLSKAFEKADRTGVLELEEGDYEFLRSSIEKEIPSTWGLNPNISKAIEEFMNAKQE